MPKKKRILIIDDDKFVLNGFKRALELEGYRVDTAETGKAAIAKSKADFYDLALIDIRLPDVEGTQLVSELHEGEPKMVKIIVTGYASQDNAVEALNQGADGYIIKPVLNMNEFLKTIKKHLKKYEETKKLQ